MFYTLLEEQRNVERFIREELVAMCAMVEGLTEEEIQVLMNASPDQAEAEAQAFALAHAQARAQPPAPAQTPALAQAEPAEANAPAQAPAKRVRKTWEAPTAVVIGQVCCPSPPSSKIYFAFVPSCTSSQVINCYLYNLVLAR